MEKRQIEPPSLTRVHVVIWRQWGIFQVRAFNDFTEASHIYHTIQEEFTRHKDNDPSFALYLMYYLAGYRDDT